MLLYYVNGYNYGLPSRKLYPKVKILKPGSHITVMIPAVPAVVSKAEYDYGTAGTADRFQSCPRYRRQSSILSAVPPVPYSQTKGIS